MEKIENQWVIIEAGYTGKDGNYIDITKPYVGKKKGATVVTGINMILAEAVKAERNALLQDVNKIASAAASYWRKPKILGEGARSFVGVTDVPSFGTVTSNANTMFEISDATANQFTLTATGSNEGVIVVATITQQGVFGTPTITLP